MAVGRGDIRVMVVDDTEHVRRMLASMLTLDGFDVVGEASAGGEALELIDKVDPDVVIMDYKMPHLDGIDTARALRLRRPDQTIILYTAFVDDDLEQQARDAGIAVCLPKVEGLPTLEREIRRLFTT